ncbi:hypothetical protein PGB90_007613 [Kerria lacca]
MFQIFLLGKLCGCVTFWSPSICFFTFTIIAASKTFDGSFPGLSFGLSPFALRILKRLTRFLVMPYSATNALRQGFTWLSTRT